MATKNTDNKTYKIKSGDTLSALAKKLGTTVEVLMDLNPDIKDKDKIQAGQVLNISKEGAQDKSGQMSTYEIQSGDTLGALAKRFNTTVESLLSLNPDYKGFVDDPTGGTIFAGDTLNVSGTQKKGGKNRFPKKGEEGYFNVFKGIPNVERQEQWNQFKQNIKESGLGKLIGGEKSFEETGLGKLLGTGKSFKETKLGETLGGGKPVEETKLGQLLSLDKPFKESDLGQLLGGGKPIKETKLGKIFTGKDKYLGMNRREFKKYLKETGYRLEGDVLKQGEGEALREPVEVLDSADLVGSEIPVFTEEMVLEDTANQETASEFNKGGLIEKYVDGGEVVTTALQGLAEKFKNSQLLQKLTTADKQGITPLQQGLGFVSQLDPKLGGTLQTGMNLATALSGNPLGFLGLAKQFAQKRQEKKQKNLESRIAGYQTQMGSYKERLQDEMDSELAAQEKYGQEGVYYGAKGGVISSNALPFLSDSYKRYLATEYGSGGKVERKRPEHLKYEYKGGGMVYGPSHKKGGVKYNVGGRVVELEGGEAVINKESTEMFKPILSQINQAGGGVRFDRGGLVNNPSVNRMIQRLMIKNR